MDNSDLVNRSWHKRKVMEGWDTQKEYIYCPTSGFINLAFC